MLAQLKTVDLIKEAISGASAFVGSIAGSKWPETKDLSSTRQSILVLKNEGYYM
jgi:hypothetical protein